MEPLVYEIEAYGSKIGDGVTNPRYCTLKGVVKENGSKFAVANELICGRLALALGIPTPPGAIVSDSSTGELFYVGMRIGKISGPLAPGSPSDLVADLPHLAAKVVVFDHWIGNHDRHSKNYMYSSSGLPPAFIDHERALLGPGNDFVVIDDVDRALTEIPRQFGPIAPELNSGPDLLSAVALVRGISSATVEGVLTEAVDQAAIDQNAADKAKVFLQHRQGELLELLKRNVHLNSLIGTTLGGVTP